MNESPLRAVLSANLRRLIEAERDEEGRPSSIRAWALKRELPVRMIDRLVNEVHGVTLDNLDLIASQCGLQAWHLLIPDLDPNNPPDATLTEDDRALLARLRNILDKG